jgi:acyl-CoA thioester hydrolase
MGVMNNSRYLEYFEAGRNTLLRDIGYPYVQLENNNIGLPVIEAFAKYILYAKYDDVVTVKAFLKNIPSVRVKLDYELFVHDKLIATGYTMHAFIKLDTLKPVRPPRDFVELVKSKISN